MRMANSADIAYAHLGTINKTAEHQGPRNAVTRYATAGNVPARVELRCSQNRRIQQTFDSEVVSGKHQTIFKNDTGRQSNRHVNGGNIVTTLNPPYRRHAGQH
uniref:Uncharacterized protein n=1 Tax=Photinus pyralis TaxID=7054 RepID=A0A1Y1KV99_PHOPY